MDKKKRTTGAVPLEPMNIKPSRLFCIQMVEKFLLVWLDKSIGKIDKDDCHNTISQLRQIVNTVNTYASILSSTYGRKYFYDCFLWKQGST
jgi:hypothetical protein